jgi:hypothetical protein
MPSILRRSCRLVPGFFIPILHSRPFQHIFLDVRSFGVLGVTSSLFCPLRLCTLRHVTFVLWVILLLAAANSFCGPQFPWVRIFLKTFLLHCVPAARRDIFLQTAANFLWDPQSPRVSSFGSPRRPTARCWPLCRFFIVPKDLTVASSVGTSQCSTSDFTSSGFSYLLSRHSSVVTWQDIVSF